MMESPLTRNLPDSRWGVTGMLLIDGFTEERDAVVEVEEVLRFLLQGLRQSSVDCRRSLEASDVAVSQAVFVLHPNSCKPLGVRRP